MRMSNYLIQHPVQLIPCLNNSIPVIAINHKNKTLRVLEVVPPQWTDLYLEGTISFTGYANIDNISFLDDDTKNNKE